MQQNLGYPRSSVFKIILQNNLIIHCDVTVDDFERSLQIFSTSEPFLKGCMTYLSQIQHTAVTMNIPRELKHIHKKIQLYVDLCYINKLVFIVTRSDTVDFITMDFMENNTKDTMITFLLRIKKRYTSRGFIIPDMFSDNEFDSEDIKSAMLPTTLHICAANERVPKIKHLILTIKERSRTICYSIPYSSFPKLTTKSLSKVVTQ